MIQRCLCYVLFSVFLSWPVFAADSKAAGVSIPVLAYHRFAQAREDSMTVRNEVFAGQLKILRQQGYTVIPLRLAVDALQGKAVSLPARPVVITVDDGHRSVYSDLRPVILREKIPVTLFIYPSAISNASYGMRWEQLAELKASGWFDIQSHTYWHPNFRIEKRRLSAPDYQTFVRNQLEKSRRVLRQRLNVEADMLAWPFGIYDEELMKAAQAAGYVAAFSIEGRHARSGDAPLAFPRYLMVDAQGLEGFEKLLKEGKR